jgi:hypothetical protein
MRLAMLTRERRDGMTAVDIPLIDMRLMWSQPCWTAQSGKSKRDTAHRRGHYQSAALTAVVQPPASATCAKCSTAQAGIWLPIAPQARRRTHRDLS